MDLCGWGASRVSSHGFFMLIALVPWSVAGCGTEAAEAPPALSELEQDLFHRSCAFASCHSGSSPAGDLDLSGSVYEELVDVPATGPPRRLRVVPGMPEASYLFEKLTAKKPAEGDIMPPGAQLRDDARIEALRAWIAAGAADD